MKKYNIRCAYCGSTISKWEWLLKLRLVFTDKYVHHCPVCHKQSTWINIFHLRHESTDPDEKLFNRSKIWESRIR